MAMEGVNKQPCPIEEQEEESDSLGESIPLEDPILITYEVVEENTQQKFYFFNLEEESMETSGEEDKFPRKGVCDTNPSVQISSSNITPLDESTLECSHDREEPLLV